MARHALLIGAQKFDDERIHPLNAPDKDVRALDAVLRDSAIGGFDNVELCLNESYNSVRDKIVSLTSNKNRDDLLFLYYSGHGILDFDSGLHLLTRTSNLDKLAAASFHSDEIKFFLNRTRSRRQILVLDCCHAGAFIGDGYKDSGARPAIVEDTFDPVGYGRIVMMSSSTVQLTPDGLSGSASLSPFTHFLVEGLKDGLAAPDSEEISVQSLAAYVEERMLREAPGSTPRIHEDKTAGPIIIAHNPQAGAARIPVELRSALTDSDLLRRSGAIARLKGLCDASDPLLRRAIHRLLESRQREERDADLRDELRAALRSVPRATVDARHNEQNSLYSEKSETNSAGNTESIAAKSETLNPASSLEEMKKRIEEYEISLKSIKNNESQAISEKNIVLKENFELKEKIREIENLLNNARRQVTVGIPSLQREIKDLKKSCEDGERREEDLMKRLTNTSEEEKRIKELFRISLEDLKSSQDEMKLMQEKTKKLEEEYRNAKTNMNATILSIIFASAIIIYGIYH